MNTAKIAEPISGNKLYQQRARAALPLLVRQAEAGVPIIYSDLAKEMGMRNERNLNYPLASIGQSLEDLSEAWKQKVPPIQCLVLNKNTGLPGEGIGWFLVKKEEFSALSLHRKRFIVNAELQKVFSYPRWQEVLEFFSLTPIQSDFSTVVSMASGPFRGGESKEHIVLKEYVAKNPWAIGLKTIRSYGRTECPLPSGDSLDVSFKNSKIWVAAEVKTARSNEADIVRGLFQCVKYRAVMEAVLSSETKPQNAKALLVLESFLPQSLVSLRNILGIEVVEGINPDG